MASAMTSWPSERPRRTTARYRRGPLALERAIAAIFALVERTPASGADELRLVAAQDESVALDRHFPAARLR